MDRADAARLLWIAAGATLPAARGAAEACGATLQHAGGVPEAVEHFKRSQIEAAVVCFPLPEYTPGETLEELQRADSSVPLILWDARMRLQDGVRLIKSG